MTILEVLLLLLFVGSLIWAIDQHLEILDIKKDLNEYLGNLLVARDIAEGRDKVHYQAAVSAVKTLIRKHFKL